MTCDVLIVGGGTGGTAAAIALANKGLSVVLTEETDWLGGQLTSQLVPPDEHPWIESFGCTWRYRDQRRQWREWFILDLNSVIADGVYRQRLTINPGGGWVSRLCIEPQYILQSLDDFFQDVAWSFGLLHVLREHRVVRASMRDGHVEAVMATCLQTRKETWIEPKFVLDATELGDLLPMTGTAYVTGAESQDETGEPHAVSGPAQPDNVQAFTWCAAVGYDPSGNHTIDKPAEYDFWRSFVPPDWTGNLLDLTFPNVRTGAPMTLPLFDQSDRSDKSDKPLTLFGYRQIVDPSIYTAPVEAVTVMNWPQNDYMLGHVIDVDQETVQNRLNSSKQLTLSVLYWLQTELGFKGLRLRPDIAGTDDGLAKAPYHRESRRIRALRTVKEQDVSPECNPGCNVAPDMWDSVGVGAYRIDLHPSSNGARTIDISSLPFQIPLGALIPVETKNLVPACKNIGTTHVTNGCYRLHPVEWNIGEAAGLLAFTCIQSGLTPQELYADRTKVEDFQRLLVQEGVELAWPKIGPL